MLTSGWRASLKNVAALTPYWLVLSSSVSTPDISET